MIVYNKRKFHINNSSSLPLKELKRGGGGGGKKLKLSSENTKILKSLGFAVKNKNE